MLLWIGAFLCLIAYSIQASSIDDASNDYVSIILSPLYI